MKTRFYSTSVAPPAAGTLSGQGSKHKKYLSLLIAGLFAAATPWVAQAEFSRIGVAGGDGTAFTGNASGTNGDDRSPITWTEIASGAYTTFDILGGAGGKGANGADGAKSDEGDDGPLTEKSVKMGAAASLKASKRDGGSGGRGSDVAVNVTANDGFRANSLTLTGGQSGIAGSGGSEVMTGLKGGNGGNGGNGGDVELKISAESGNRVDVTSALSLEGARGANGAPGGTDKGVSENNNGGLGGDGGAGGGAKLSILSGELYADSQISLTAGDGGNSSGAPDNPGQAAGGAGGAGGKVSLDAQTVTVAKVLAVTSGKNGTGLKGSAGGAGGAASFTAASLSAPDIMLTKNDGALNFVVGLLDASQIDTRLMLDGTASDDVRIDTLKLGGGKSFAMTGKGAYTPFKAYAVHGKASYVGNLDAQNATFNFYVPDATASGSTLLTVTGNADISGSVVNVGVAGTVDISSAWQIALIDATGALTATGANFSNAGGNSLMAGISRIYDIKIAVDPNDSSRLIASIPAYVPPPAPPAPTPPRGRLTWNGSSANWNDDPAATGWKTTATDNTYFESGDEVVFDATGVSNTDVTLDSDITAGSIEISADGYRFSGGNLTVKQMTLNHAASFTGDVTLAGDVRRLTVRSKDNLIDGNLKATDASLYFYVPASVAAEDAMLKVTGNADLSGSTVNVNVASSYVPTLEAGDQFYLLLADGDLTTENTRLNLLAGISQIYRDEVLRLSTDEHRVIVSLDPRIEEPPPESEEHEDLEEEEEPIAPELPPRAEQNPQVKALSEGFLGGLILTAQGTEVAANQGIAAARAAGLKPLADHEARRGLYAFATIAGGDLKYDSGSHIDLQSGHTLIGVGAMPEVKSGLLLLGAFVEYGTGSFDTHNSFGNAPSIDGDGDAHYAGVGVLGRYEFQGGAYAEGSVRAGRLKNDFSSDGFRLSGMPGVHSKYDSRTSYSSVHVGGGYIWNVNEAAQFDAYAKAFLTRVEADKVKLSTLETVKFAAATSERLRIGGRYTQTVNVQSVLYAGLAYEHEFAGKAKAKIDGVKIATPEIEGDSWIGEVGFRWQPGAGSPFSMEIGLQGYSGKREGVTGNVEAKWVF